MIERYLVQQKYAWVGHLKNMIFLKLVFKFNFRLFLPNSW